MADAEVPTKDTTDPGYQPSAEDMYAATHRQAVGPRVGIFAPDHPELPANQNYGWTNTQTGQHFTGGLTSDGRSIVTGFTGSNPQNTTAYDVQTGTQSQADPHQWNDVWRNMAMIWGGPETAGLLTGAFAPAGALPGAGAPAAASPLAAAGPTTAAVVPAVATTAAGTTGALAGLTLPHILSAAGPIVAGIVNGIVQHRQQQAQDTALNNQQSLQAAALAQSGNANQVNQQLSQRQAQATDYQRNYRNALLATLLNGVQDVNINVPADVAAHMGTVTGGLRPSAMPNRAQIGTTVLPQALTALQSNPSFNNLLPPSGAVNPNLQPIEAPSGAGLNTLALTSAILTGANNLGLFRGSGSPMTPPSIPSTQPLDLNPMNGISFAPNSPGAFNPFYVPSATQPGAFNWPSGPTPNYFG
jgi:hypothetical protein